MARLRHCAKACLVAVVAAFLLPFGCDYARMTSDEGHDTYEAYFPAMPADSIGVTGGMTAMGIIGPEGLDNPLPPGSAAISDGRQSYANFCIHCHGPKGDGNATVGQSFAPLPTDLRSERVQSQSDGVLFMKIGFGFQRHPPMGYSMMENDIWAVILFMRSMGNHS